MGCLYKLTSPSGKSYIGISSKGLEARWAKHVEHALGKRTAGALYAALRKYGTDSFSREVIGCSDDWDTLRQMEIDAIRDHGTLAPRGYNITQGGEGTRDRLSDQARANISAAQRKRYARPEERERLLRVGEAARKRMSEDAAAKRAQLKAERQRYLTSPEFKARHSASVREAMARPAVAEKVRECARKRASDPLWRARISESKRGKSLAPCSDERKLRIAEARRREWADPVMRSKRLAAFASARSRKAESTEEIR